MPARYLGVDLGMKRIGLALGESETRIASPLKVLAAHSSAKENARAILKVADEYAVDGIVVGLPLNMDGTDSAQTGLTRKLADELRKHVACPVELWDERLSSFQADQYLAAADVRRSRRRALRDALAAQVILQAFLDAGRTDGDDREPAAPPTP